MDIYVVWPHKPEYIILLPVVIDSWELRYSCAASYSLNSVPRRPSVLGENMFLDCERTMISQTNSSSCRDNSIDVLSLCGKRVGMEVIYGNGCNELNKPEKKIDSSALCKIQQ